MLSVASLLNPMPSPSPSSKTSSPPPSYSKSQNQLSELKVHRIIKMSKALAMPAKAKPNGIVHYSPCEIQDDVIQAQHARFAMQRIESIRDYPRHIPYNSEKKTFQQRTGKDGFEVFQYAFRMPDDPVDKEPYTVMWDYNIGLVRITAFFKSLRHPKTMPAKVMNANPGLKNISHSITGGSISAQGYWIPFAAAKAIAARFCWDIRYVLTPLFGANFPASCVEPRNPLFLKLKIDANIINHCTEIANGLRAQSRRLSASDGSPLLPNVNGKLLEPNMVPKQDCESGYGTDTDRSMPGSASPPADCKLWTPINGHRLKTLPRFRQKLIERDNSFRPQSTLLDLSTVEKVQHKKRLRNTEEDFAEHYNGSKKVRLIGRATLKGTRHPTPMEEARAAYALVELHKADASLESQQRTIERRASC